MKCMLRFILILLVPSQFAVADNPSPCDDLARFACAPGGFNDGTGEAKDYSEIQKSVSLYSEESKAALYNRFQKILSSENTLSDWAQKKFPQCWSKSSKDIAACQKDLIEGLTATAQSMTLGDRSRTQWELTQNLSYLYSVLTDSRFQEVVSDFVALAQKNMGNSDTFKKIENKIFPQVKDLIIERLRSLSLPENELAMMVNKIKAIKLDPSTSCTSLEPHDVVAAQLVTNASYNSHKNSFQVCSGLFWRSTSEFQLVAIIAHELSHSLDPCFIMDRSEKGFKYKKIDVPLDSLAKEYPIKNIIDCLRDARSIGAKNFNVSLGGYPTGVLIGTGLPAFCAGDQITESFADWMATEVLPRYMQNNFKLTADQYKIGYSNAYRSLCGPKPRWGDEHPSTEKRINKIILVNPKIRAQMGCSEKSKDGIYCDPAESFLDANRMRIAPEAITHESGGTK